MATATDRGWPTIVPWGAAGVKRQQLFRLSGWANTCTENRSADGQATAGSYRCAACGRAYATMRSLYRHRKKHAATKTTTTTTTTATDWLPLRQNRCGVCGGTSSVDARLRFGCAQCLRSCRDNGRAYTQVLRNSDAPYACTECAKTYRSDRALKRHALYAHGKGRRRFECDACDKTFASNSTLQRHLVLANCAGKPCERCTNTSCKDDRKSVILRRVFSYVLSRAVTTRSPRHV